MIRSTTSEGSPPHTRGKGGPAALSALGGGITPAYAGKREQEYLWDACQEDHPRIRGEKDDVVKLRHLYSASPPHTRGKGNLPKYCTVHGGITPAYAGKRRRIYSSFLGIWDHPRIRGEKGSRFGGDTHPMGSPPHTRGKARAAGYLVAVLGITPAYAGKSPIK